MSRLDYFANNAPPVPDWFKAAGPLPPRPQTMTEKFGKERVHAFFRLNSKREPIPDDLFEVAAYWEQLRADALIHEAAVAEIRFFQWRSYYARRMVETLSEVDA